jgi:hypothetical protein
MTKTVTAAGPYRFAKLVLPVFMPVGTNADRSFVWNFEMRLSGKSKLPKKINTNNVSIIQQQYKVIRSN